MLSLDDYIKSQKKSGKMFGRGRGGGGGGGRRGPRPSAAQGRGGNSARAGSSGNRNFRGQKPRQGGPGGGGRNNNVQRRRGNRGFGNGNNRRNFVGGAAASNQPRGNFQRFGGGGGGVQSGPGSNRRLNRNRSRNANRQVARPRNSGGGNRNPGFANPQRYFNNIAPLMATGKAKRNQGRRLRQKIPALLNVPVGLKAVTASKRAVLKLAQKRVQRAKLLVSKKKIGAGRTKQLIPGASNVGRVALGKNGFFTVRNTKAKQMERSLVKLKIARAQNARNRLPSQSQQRRNVNLPGPSGMGNRAANRSIRVSTSSGPHPLDWNTPIVRTMRNDLVDEMTSSQLNPEIQRKIAFIQSRSKGDRAPVMQDFKAPVTTSRMKLSDRFRLLHDQ